MLLKSNSDLEQSGVVANCRMNRERVLRGSNGYNRDLRFDPVEFLHERAACYGSASWLDLCCGTGRALAGAAELIKTSGRAVSIIGVDLVGMFDSHEHPPKRLQLIERSLSEWKTSQSFDLITCVHGLHYIGDKLTLIQRACGWLKDSGRFAANLDMENIGIERAMDSSRLVVRALRGFGLDYDFRRHLLRCDGRRLFNIGWLYLGADDSAGGNYTGQPAVNSYYRRDK